MYLTGPANLGEQEPGEIRPRDTLPYREAMAETERRQREEYDRDCRGIRLIETLERVGLSPVERVRCAEQVLKLVPVLFRLKQTLAERVRSGRMLPAQARAIMAGNLQRLGFPAGNALLNAPVYDCTVGMAFFLRVRQAFSKLVPRYGIRFCSAADIGCGTGLFACYLNNCWVVPVYGVDRSLEMLRQASRNCPSAGACFLQQDLRCLALPSQAKVNAAEALQSFGNLEKPAPAAARKATAPGNPLHDQE